MWNNYCKAFSENEHDPTTWLAITEQTAGYKVYRTGKFLLFPFKILKVAINFLAAYQNVAFQMRWNLTLSMPVSESHLHLLPVSNQGFLWDRLTSNPTFIC